MARRTAIFDFQFFPHVSKFTWTIIRFIGLDQRNLTRKPFHINGSKLYSLPRILDKINRNNKPPCPEAMMKVFRSKNVPF